MSGWVDEWMYAWMYGLVCIAMHARFRGQGRRDYCSVGQFEELYHARVSARLSTRIIPYVLPGLHRAIQFFIQNTRWPLLMRQLPWGGFPRSRV